MVGIDDLVYIGNHGYERWVGGSVELVPNAEEYPAKVEAVLDRLSSLICIEGVIFENKGPTASIHYRRCHDREAALRAINKAVAGLVRESGLRVSQGKMTVELRPPLEVSKWTAVRTLIAEHSLSGVIYLGDDVTDVDVFVALHHGALPFKGLGIGVVGEETITDVMLQADFTLNGVGDVERFLKRVAAEVAGRPAP